MVLKICLHILCHSFQKMESKSQPLERGLDVVIHLQRLECGRSDGVCLPRLGLEEPLQFLLSGMVLLQGKSVALL